MSINRWIKGLVIAGGALTAAACSTYPDAPRYSTRPTTPGVPQIQGQGQGQGTSVPAYPTNPMPAPRPYEPPPPIAAPYEPIQGGALPPSGSSVGPTYLPERPVAPPISSGAALGSSGTVAYVIQPGDTISGVGRRFQAPVQSLIDLNSLGPRGAITTGQRIILPDNAVDLGPDPYATGPAPIGVAVTNAGTAPPPPPPPMAMAPAPMPAPLAPVAAPAASAASTPTSVALQWPVRGEVVRRFGPVGMGERNNGINIGASAGAEVVASAAGRVAYVGDDLVGQGLTVLIVHRDGWRTVYGHLGSATVDDGSDVRAGQQIGTVGLTAGDGRPSIHFETRRMSGDEPVAIDPLTVLPR